MRSSNKPKTKKKTLRDFLTSVCRALHGGARAPRDATQPPVRHWPAWSLRTPRSTASPASRGGHQPSRLRPGAGIPGKSTLPMTCEPCLLLFSRAFWRVSTESVVADVGFEGSFIGPCFWSVFDTRQTTIDSRCRQGELGLSDS